MDWFYLIIFVVALVVYYLDAMHRKKEKEHFSEAEFPPKKLGVDFSAPSPDPSASMGMTNIKFPGIPKARTRPTKFGPVPPQMRCNVTVLGENCSNYPQEDSLSHFGQVCQKSFGTYPVGDLGFRSPLYVMGNSLSRVRQCNNIYDPANNIANVSLENYDYYGDFT